MNRRANIEALTAAIVGASGMSTGHTFADGVNRDVQASRMRRLPARSTNERLSDIGVYKESKRIEQVHGPFAAVDYRRSHAMELESAHMILDFLKEDAAPGVAITADDAIAALQAIAASEASKVTP